MIPVVQLDPATLCLWYDPELVSRVKGGEAVARAVHAAQFGDLTEVIDFISTIGDERSAIRAVNLVSSVWHEHRHFLDLILTNYGAFRLRLYTSIYGNIDPILAEIAHGDKTLVCPLDVYADPVRRRVLGVTLPSANIQLIAENLRSRKEWLREDNAPMQTPFGMAAAGGEAQLEALAFFCQLAGVQEVFGPEISEAVQKDLPEIQRRNLRYRWAEIAAQTFGLLPTVSRSGKVFRDFTVLSPLLVASLMCRKYGQKQSVSGTSGFPFARFATLCSELGKRPLNFGELSLSEAWEIINATAKQLWDRTVLEEAEEDFAKEREWVARFNEQVVGEDVANTVRDVHTLRSKLLEILHADPGAIIDPKQFVKDLLFRLRPIPIIASKSGQLGSPEGGWERVLGYRDPEGKENGSQWWWAAAPEKWNPDEEVFALRERRSWLTVASDYAPLAKLILNGRAHRTMLGPEILSIEMRMKHSGINIRFDPVFAFPEEPNDIESFFELTGQDAAVCDFCRDTVPRSEGYLVSPWIFRYSERNADLCVRAFGGGQQGQLKYWRDWSPWVFCRNCQAQFISQSE
ncbi:MAG TPA: hypothetical protein VGW57_01570 [Chthoniobacterales bacterium]|nr:hypothetical protein [Chthoniobacterales bacterium]